LLPALKESLARGQRVVYTTPKNSLHLVAEDAVKRLRAKKVAIKSLTLTAKAKMCLLPEPVCDPKVCEYARDYYTKISENKLVEEASKTKQMTPQHFTELGKKHKVCPFELSIDCIDRADVVICDYNHVFAPVSLSGRLTAAVHKKNAKPNLIIDEAHNLHTRAADYFSASISTPQLVAWHSELLTTVPKMAAHAADGVRILRDAVALTTQRNAAATVPANTSSDIELGPRQFTGLADRINRSIMDLVEESAAVEQIAPALTFSRSWSEFTAALTHENIERFTTCKTASGDVTLKVTCCDGSAHLRAQYKLFDNVIAFSATLKPFEYYTKLSGFDSASCELLEATSPFPRHNRKLMVIPQISTKYKDRNANYAKIADAIARITAVKHVNYIIFFPSFDFLERIAERVSAPAYKMLVQRRSMSRHETSALLDELRTTQPCLLFAVQGGIFSEGIDFAGDMASGAIIVGPGLPTYDLERELLRQYYDKAYGQGFEYAYVYPAMTKVIQSAGRIVRSETDRGLLVLMDNRFLSDQYARAMPADWFHQNVTELVSTSILKDISDFWQDTAH
jgi:DNA excision repair protein ERCC-2